MHIHEGIYRSDLQICWKMEVMAVGKSVLRTACLKISLQTCLPAAVTEEHSEQGVDFGFLNALWSPKRIGIWVAV